VTASIGVGVVGFGWMGQVHTRAYERLRSHYPDEPLRPELVAVAEADDRRREDACRRHDFLTATADWRDLLDDDRIGIISVTLPNFLHREVGAAVARSGRHLWIEKPVGSTVEDARAVADAVRAGGVRAAVGFNYRNAPAVEHARDLIRDGALGEITNSTFRLLADYAAHPQAPLSWRFNSRLGGPGVLGDLVSHGADLARHLLGEVTELVADTAVFIPARPAASAAVSHFSVAEDAGELQPVGNDDYASCLLRFASGARGTLESSRVSIGDQCTYGFEIHGTRGRLSWDFRRMGELQVSIGDRYLDQPTSTVFVGPPAGEYAAFQPGAGIALGYDDLKVIEAARLLRSVATGTDHGATVEDAVASARVVEAMLRSAATRQWVRLGA
jgi:predicted dehydrogenase